MESTSRRVAFAVIVFALVALGAYLIGTVRQGGGPGTAAQAGTAARPAPAAARGRSAPAAGTAAAQPAPPDIYQWLPFTQAGLAAAASVAEKFGDAYGTYSYTQTPAQYVAPMRSLASAAVTEQIEAAYATAGVAAARTSGRQVSAGSAAIESIDAFGPDSLTFIMQVTQQVTASTGHSQLSEAYAVTLTGSGTTWQVTAIELASVGNS